jgi:WD40 repeat protein
LCVSCRSNVTAIYKGTFQKLIRSETINNTQLFTYTNEHGTKGKFGSYKSHVCVELSVELQLGNGTSDAPTNDIDVPEKLFDKRTHIDPIIIGSMKKNTFIVDFDRLLQSTSAASTKANNQQNMADYRTMFPGSFGGKKSGKREATPKTNANATSKTGINMFLSAASSKPPPKESIKQQEAKPVIKGPRFETVKAIKSTRDDEEDVLKITATSSVNDEEVVNMPDFKIYDRVRHFDEQDDDGDDEIMPDTSDEKIIPTTNFAVMSGHEGAVSAITIDPSGSRVISGSHDYSIRFWDFAGMNKSLQSFREKEEASEGCYLINQLAFSITGDSFLMAPDTVQCRLFDRDGLPIAVFRKGDPYIADMSKTNGHVAAITGIGWHPQHKELCLTSSMDGTCRIWDIDRCEEKQRTVIKARNQRGIRTPVTCCAFDVDKIVAGCNDGSIHVWDSKLTVQRPNILIRDAHKANTNITCVRLSRDTHYLASRGTDETLKLWDLRKPTTPLFVKDDLPCRYDNTDCLFSPVADERYVVTATSAVQLERGHILRKGQLLFLDRANNFAVARTLEYDFSILRITWHQGLNQMLLGCDDGNIRVGYDEKYSRKGVLPCLTKALKKRNIDEVITAEPVIHTPFALPMFKKEPSQKKLEEKARGDPIKSKRPSDAPTSGPGHSGKVSDNLTHMLMKEMGVVKKATEWQEDPREAILKYAQVAEESPSIVTPAYAKTQPKPIFDFDSLEREYRDQRVRELEDEEKSARNRFGQNKRQKTE